MKAININDVIFATVSQHGCVLASLTLSGVTSLSDVMKHLRASVSGVVGMVTLQLRNMSQGWSQRTTFVPASAPLGRSCTRMPVQLSLF